MSHMEHTQALRANTQVHFNCFQSVVVPFAKELGLTQEQAYALGAHFGSGMRHGATCGALSGALLVLAAQFIRDFRESHGATDCATLLKASHDRGEVKKEHCDGLVYEMVQALDALLEQKG